MVCRRGAGRGRRGDPIHGREGGPTLSLRTYTSSELLPIVIDEKGNRTTAEREGMMSTRSDSLEAMLSESQSVLKQFSAARELLTPIRNVAHDALLQGFEMLDEVSVVENSRNGHFERVKEEKDVIVEKVSSYKWKRRSLRRRSWRRS